MIIPNYDNLLERYKASCRVDANEARGSATIIYSKDGMTYALTNYHVIAKNINHKAVWDNILQKKVTKEFTDAVQVLYPRVDGDRILGYETAMADIILHDEQQDIALLKIRDIKTFPSTDWYPKDKAEDVPILVPLACIGAALGTKPTATFGHLNSKQNEIDQFEYWMSSAPSIFGNSGGGVFAYDQESDRWLFLGIPSRIAVQPMGFGAQAITHMGFFIPVFRIFEWLEENCYQFLYDESYTPEQCKDLRERKKELELAKLLSKRG
jgi:S1-C subfamily serine protease